MGQDSYWSYFGPYVSSNLCNVVTRFIPEEKYKDTGDNLKDFLKSNKAKLNLEYKIEEVDSKVDEFFKTAAVRTESKDAVKDYSNALFEIASLFDKRTYYLLKLIFKNKIRNH